MRKLNILIVLFFVYLSSYAQIPSGYYNTATGTGYVLKTQLYNKIKGHSDLGYNALWTTYATSHRDNYYENDNSILDIYSENPSSTDPYVYTYSTNQCGNYVAEGSCYNREHIIPQSVFNSTAPMYSDAHFIPPTDGKVNGMRNNYPHGEVATASWVSRNGGKLGTSAVAGYTGVVFEPIDEFKGDIARMYFYFATRYENTVANYNYDMFNGTSNQVFTTTFKNLLLQWHNQDPVNSREISRNNAIYARQNNRNPFIDHPEFVAMIWGNLPDTQVPNAPINLSGTGITTSSLILNWTAATDNIGVVGYDVYQNGSFITSVTTNTENISGLSPATTYTFYVRAKDASGNVSTNSNTISVTTTASVLIPTTSSFSPTTFCAQGGQQVTIIGTNFNQLTAVKFNNVAATSFSVVNATTLTAIVPSGISNGTISVTNSAGTAVAPQSFSITTPVFLTQPLPFQNTCQNESAILIGVTYTGGIGTASYQWYRNTTDSAVGGTPVANANSSTFLPPTSQTGVTYYYVVISFSNSACSSITSTTAQVYVNPSVTPIFTSIPPVCKCNPIQALPTSSSNGITGTWNPPVSNTVTTTYTFTPDTGQCATNTTMTITIYQ